MNSNNGTVRGDALATVSPGMLPPPFTVRWSTKSDCWVVWMPETNNLLMIDGTFVSITGISEAPELPSGWYTVDDLVPGSDSIYLVITITDSTGSATADLSGTQGTSSSGETVYNIKIASMTTDPNTNEKSIEQYTNSSVIIGSGGSGGGVTTDDISINSDSSGELQIKGFKAGQPADTNTIADYIRGATAIPTGGIKIVCRLVDTNGNRHLLYLPLAAIWGDGSSGGLPLPEVTYLDDVTWDATNHQLVKHWVKKNVATGVETPIQGAPQGKTATINTTPISSIITQSS